MEWSGFRKACSELAERSMSTAEAGVRLWLICSRAPDLLASGDVTLKASFGEVGGNHKVRDLLPLPMPAIPDYSVAQIDKLFPNLAPVTSEGRQAGAQAWLLLAIAGLNHMSTGSALPGRGPPTEALLYQDCGEFSRHTECWIPTNWPHEYKVKADAYWGDPIYTAVPLILRRVLPTLPPAGVAGSVDICQVLTCGLSAQLQDPESLFLPEEDWPKVPPKATTQMEENGEYKALANEMWQRDLAIWLPKSALVAPKGKAVISGLFGVEKPKSVPGHPEEKQLRLICNLETTNAYFRVLQGDVEHLPCTLQWSAIVLLDEEFLLVSQEDMSCAFYLFRLPTCWAKYFAVGFPVRLDELHGNPKAMGTSRKLSRGHDTQGEGYMCLQVLPMGWASAMGVMQAVHRKIMLDTAPKGGGLPSAAGIRKTALSSRLKTNDLRKAGSYISTISQSSA